LVDGVLILNWTVSPGCTLIDVAKPWMVADPDPEICQSLAGVPGNEFSHAIAFTTGGPHGPAAPAGVVSATNGNTRPAKPTTAARTRKRTRRDAAVERASDRLSVIHRPLSRIPGLLLEVPGRTANTPTSDVTRWTVFSRSGLRIAFIAVGTS
jgi:hypothetical protein